MKFSVHVENWPMVEPFRISGHEFTAANSIVVQLGERGVSGRGEAQGVFYLDETVDSMLAQVEAAADRIGQGVSREELLELMPPGGARNAVDCALWDLECKQSGKSIWELTGIEPKPVTTEDSSAK